MNVHFVRAGQVNLSDHHSPEPNIHLNRYPYKGLFANALNHHKHPPLNTWVRQRTENFYAAC